jgi:hypothetical protein
MTLTAADIKQHLDKLIAEGRNSFEVTFGQVITQLVLDGYTIKFQGRHHE